ncbi:outer membrane beta-barrel protein [Rufibacter roseus]|uniref:Outer membrane beta-barrel protein n=1 Tax=Rufibacter roseus TaxID=1567108 RepID=A0ABW2DE83_9BACT|nr:outer membrane beta-barrel protein [Rufibacter roseus]
MKKLSAEEKHDPSLEDIFREGFEGAESTPSSKIWENLNRELENQELKKYRGQVFWYRAAAAAILLLLVSAGAFLWNSNDGLDLVSEGTVALSKEQSNKLELNQRVKKSVANGGVSSDYVDEGLASVSGPFSEKQAKNTREVLRGEKAIATVDQVKKGSSSQVKETAPGFEPTEEVIAQVKIDSNSNSGSKSSTGLEAELAVAAPVNPATASSVTALNGLSGGVVTKADSAAEEKPGTLLLRKSSPDQLLAQTAAERKEISPAVAEVSKWSLSLAYAPQYAYSPIKLNEGSMAPASFTELSAAQPQVYQEYQKAMREFNQSYSPSYSYSARLGASYSINDKWHVESGLLYAENVATTTHSYVINSTSTDQMSNRLAVLRAEPIFNNVAQYQTGNVVSVSKSDTYTTQYRYQQVGLPVRIGYRHDLSKFFAYASGGVNLNLLLKNSITPQNNQLETVHYEFGNENSPFRSWQCFSVTSVGLGYELNDKVSVMVAPEVTYALTPFLKESESQPNAFQFGLSIGSKWRIYK